MDDDLESFLYSNGTKPSPLGRAVLEAATKPAGNVSDEAGLLLRALRGRLHGNMGRWLDGLQCAEFDWKHMLHISTRHRVVPPLYACTRAIDKKNLPETFVSQLQSRYRANGIHNEYQVAELLKIIDRFKTDSIRAISYKGPTLAQVAYGNLSLRSFADLDLLIHRKDLPQAVSILLDREYTWRGNQPVPPEASITGGPLVPPLTYEWKFDRQRDRAMVELGWQLHTVSTPTSLGFETLWSRAEGIDLGDGAVTGLSPSDRLLVLAHHGATHRWGELKWIYDFAAVINRNDLPEWERIINRSRRYGLQRRLYTALGLTTALFGVPQGRVTRIVRSDETAVTLAAAIVGQYLTDPLYEPSKYSEFLFRIKSTDTIQAAAMAVTEPLTPKLKDYQWAPLPQVLFPVYYFTRPIRLIEGSVRSLWTSFAEQVDRNGRSER